MSVYVIFKLKMKTGVIEIWSREEAHSSKLKIGLTVCNVCHHKLYIILPCNESKNIYNFSQ